MILKAAWTWTVFFWAPQLKRGCEKMEVLDAPYVVSWVLDARLWMLRWIQELLSITFDGCQL